MAKKDMFKYKPGATVQAKWYLRKKLEMNQLDDVEQVVDRIFCGCGAYEDAEQAMRELFSLFKNDDELNLIDRDKWNEFVEKHGEGFTTLMLYWMNELGLAEHGGSVGGSWLSPLGVEVRSFFI